MSKFKVGDTVRRTQFSNGNMAKGNIGVISEVWDSGMYIISGHDNVHFESYLELIIPQIKVNDVAYVKSLGAKYIVDSIDGNFVDLRNAVYDKYIKMWPIGDCEFTPVCDVTTVSPAPLTAAEDINKGVEVVIEDSMVKVKVFEIYTRYKNVYVRMVQQDVKLRTENSWHTLSDALSMANSIACCAGTIKLVYNAKTDELISVTPVKDTDNE